MDCFSFTACSITVWFHLTAFINLVFKQQAAVLSDLTVLLHAQHQTDRHSYIQAGTGAPKPTSFVQVWVRSVFFFFFYSFSVNSANHLESFQFWFGPLSYVVLNQMKVWFYLYVVFYFSVTCLNSHVRVHVTLTSVTPLNWASVSVKPFTSQSHNCWLRLWIWLYFSSSLSSISCHKSTGFHSTSAHK